MSMRTEVHETRTYPSLSSRTCSTSCRAGVKEEVENSVEEKLSQSSCFFFLFLQYPIITRHDISHPPVEISFHLSTWERERYIDSIYRGLFHQFLNSIFIEDCSASSSIIHIQEEIPPLLKNRVEKRKYTRSMAQSTGRATRNNAEIPANGHVHRVFIVQFITTPRNPL